MFRPPLHFEMISYGTDILFEPVSSFKAVDWQDIYGTIEELPDKVVSKFTSLSCFEASFELLFDGV